MLVFSTQPSCYLKQIPTLFEFVLLVLKIAFSLLHMGTTSTPQRAAVTVIWLEMKIRFLSCQLVGLQSVTRWSWNLCIILYTNTRFWRWFRDYIYVCLYEFTCDFCVFRGIFHIDVLLQHSLNVTWSMKVTCYTSWLLLNVRALLIYKMPLINLQWSNQNDPVAVRFLKCSFINLCICIYVYAVEFTKCLLLNKIEWTEIH